MLMPEYEIDGYFEFQFSTETVSTGAETDADALPTYRVYEENNDTVVDSGNCAKRDDANTTGWYLARAQITTALGYEVGKDYIVKARAVVGTIPGSKAIGMFRIVPADAVRDDQWTDALATLLTTAGGQVEDILHSNWTILYVDGSATGAADGTTWADAYITITAALTAAGDETTIFVAAGTYAEAITIANNDIELKSFDFDTPFAHSAGTVRVTGAANTPTCSITGDRVEIIGIDYTDHSTGERDGIYVNGADDLKITKCTVEGINGELRDALRVLGGSRELNVYGCHFYGALRNGIHVTAAETHCHFWDCSIGVEDGATAAINLSGAVTNTGLYDCRLYAAGTVAQGILLGADTEDCRATNVWCHNFTKPYTDGGTANSLINVFDMIAPADAAYYTATRGPYLDELAAANLPSDVDTLVARLTAVRAGYLDNLSAGAVALASIVTDARLAELDAANLPSDVDDLVARVGAITGSGDNTVLGILRAMASIAADLPSDIGGTYDQLTDSLQAIRDRGDAAWTSATGEGDNAVTLTLNDGDGDPVPNVNCIVRNSAETAVLARQSTDADGQVELQLDDGTYKVRLGPSGNYSFSNPYDLVVSGTTTQTLTCTALTIAATSDPDLCTCWIDLRYAEGGALLDEEEGYVQVIEVKSAGNVWPSAATEAALAVAGTRNYTDANGRASFDGVRGSELKVLVVRPWGTDYRAEEDTKEHKIDVTVPDAASYYIPLSQ